MDAYLYLSMTPEALIASMLPPTDFGTYQAVGSKKHATGQAIFFEVDPDKLEGDAFDLDAAQRECVPHSDGNPKHSVYLSVYRVLEHVNPDALVNLWLVTQHGAVLKIEPADEVPTLARKYYLYKELCPVHPLVASVLGPADFCAFITSDANRVRLPRLCFVDMGLAEQADTVQTGPRGEMPGVDADHLRDCLASLGGAEGKHTKTVVRLHPPDVCYPCVDSGFYVGDRERLRFFPFPSRDDLQAKHYSWWQSANA